MRKKTNRKKKTRKLANYATGTGNTGMIKNFMPNPNEEFRQNQIDMDRAKSEAASNPFVMGLDMLGGVVSQAGTSMMSSSMSGGQEAVAGSSDDASQIVVPDMSNKFDYGKAEKPKTYLAAKGTGKAGLGKVDAEIEGNEVTETPNGEVTKHEGPSHENGGIDIEAPKGTLVFSDQIKIDGKTPAERKEARLKKITKIMKKLASNPTDIVNKETYKRTKENHEIEQAEDLKVQEYAGKLDKIYNAAMGTDERGLYANGTGWAGLWDETKDFATGFTGGDIVGLAGNVQSMIAPLKGARTAAATDTVNENLYKGYADEAISTVDKAGGMIDAQQASAEKGLARSANTAYQKVAEGSRGINTKRAGQLGVFAKTNQAKENLYTNFSKMMMDNLYKKSGLQAQAGQVEAQGATAADIANRQDKAANLSAITAAKTGVGTGMQQTGKDLNQKARQDYMMNVYNEMFANQVKWDKKGNLTTDD